MSFIFQCKVILGPEFDPVQAHEPGNMLSRADSLGMPRVAAGPSMLTVTPLMQIRAIPTLHTGAHTFTPAADTYTQHQTHTCTSDTQQHALHRYTQ